MKTSRRQFCKNLCAEGQMRDYWRWALGQVSAAELVDGRASTKSLYLKTPERKSKPEVKKAGQDKLRWLWFEEASEFANQG